MFENENNKEKHLGKTPNRYVKKDQNQFPKDSLFFDFFNTLKQIKINLFGTKNLFKLATKLLEDGKRSSLKILYKTAQENVGPKAHHSSFDDD